jgi:hypothetical protein
MKILLTVIMTMVFAGSAFAATCSVATPALCKDQASCEKLIKDNKAFKFEGGICLDQSIGSVATNCTELNGTSGSKPTDSDASGNSGANTVGK